MFAPCVSPFPFCRSCGSWGRKTKVRLHAKLAGVLPFDLAGQSADHGPVWLSDGEQRWAFTVRFSRLIHECMYVAWNTRDGARWQRRTAGCLLATIGTWAISVRRFLIVGENSFWTQLWWSFALTTSPSRFPQSRPRDRSCLSEYVQVDNIKW